ncbi:hypothetical protein [Streptomyces sp. NPDC057690]|uniref:hypothetical protein n=1 Tax=Streptomyces sp. NPDC057690 TaxID=3346214 RepID=UPI003699E8F9
MSTAPPAGNVTPGQEDRRRRAGRGEDRGDSLAEGGGGAAGDVPRIARLRLVAYLFDGHLSVPVYAPPAQAGRAAGSSTKAANSRAMNAE